MDKIIAHIPELVDISSKLNEIVDSDSSCSRSSMKLLKARVLIDMVILWAKDRERE